MLSRSLFAIAVVGAFAVPSRADVKVHPLFSDNAVLQRGVEVPVWGTAAPNEDIQVTLAGGDGPAAVVKTKAGADGSWKVALPKRDTATDLTLTVKGANEVAFKNVAIGDVWLCSGQSNMEWRLSQLTKDDQGKKVAAAAANPNIRLFDVPNRVFPEPQKDFPASKTSGTWLQCTPETVINFSAVGYFFGRDIQASQKVPVGLISSEWGGTPAEAWTSDEGLRADSNVKHYADRAAEQLKSFDLEKATKAYEAAMAKWKTDSEEAKKAGKPAPRAPQKPGPGGVHPHFPSALYNGMIAPLQPFPLKGAIWYQGESNAGRAAEYRSLMPALIKDWRQKWGTELPFFQVQLAPFKGGASGVDYAELRDAQFNTTQILPKAGIAVITDVGDETDIHPQRKEPVGQRLALAARALAYDEKIEYSGPTYKSLRVDGDKAVVTFEHLGGGLTVKGDGLAGFTVAGEDNAFHPAMAEIVGDTVVVKSDKVAKPVAVRFGWVNFAKPELNLFNKAGLPAVPFRSDDLPLTTLPKKK